MAWEVQATPPVTESATQLKQLRTYDTRCWGRGCVFVQLHLASQPNRRALTPDFQADVGATGHNRAVVSSFGWLDTDNEQRRKMLEVVDLFKEEGTVDELGIGSIRDAFADSLFPGTSVLQTRLRYILFIPWLMQHAAQGNRTATEMSATFRNSEFYLINALKAGDEKLGVIGNTARGKLKRLPSSMYWAAMGSWGIRNGDLSPEAFFRRQYEYRRLASRTAKADDPESRELTSLKDLDPHLPPPPSGWLGGVNFTLTSDEEQYLSDVITASNTDSVFAWLIRNQPKADLPNYVWDLTNLAQAPEQLRDLVDHARRFHSTIYGAAVLYNLLLARKREDDELIDQYEAKLSNWRDELQETECLNRWSRTDWWATVRRCNPRVRPATVTFVNNWIDLSDSDVDIAHDSTAAKLVAARERQIKGGRARLANQAALDRWSGSSGLSRLDYRWSVARRHLTDLYAARTSV